MSNQENFELSKTDPALLKLVSGGTISFKAFEEDILALASVIAGTSHQNLSEIEDSILKLKREPDNEYDKFAICILFEEHKLGYIPKAKNQTIARLMDAGKEFYAKATHKEWEGKWLKIDMEVFLKD